eukprot:TRINITY_DN1668_c0_g1_i3.p1 TRINITY_DN1668_c0_g1~~TRINITY_DN1668_c0_g1_i3.p1  ORF type:complete len:119 (+),score=56.45 TRINITY_DN1668_c0_g1_i3:118-474(+)
MQPQFRYAFFHGFGTTASRSTKAQLLSSWFRTNYSIELHLPNLNQPTFETFNVSSAIGYFDQLNQQIEPNNAPWRIIGSSMGGLIAALWASKNEQAVDSLLLLCPAFVFAYVFSIYFE